MQRAGPFPAAAQVAAPLSESNRKRRDRMFGWRKRKDGFEWREYVRTTILVRRKHRRERVEKVARAAVDGLKAAGERGAAAGLAGAQALGRGAVAAGQHGAMMGAAGVRAADAGLRSGLPKAWRGLEAFGFAAGRACARIWGAARDGTLDLAAMLAPHIERGWFAIEPLVLKLRRPGITIVLALIAGVAFVGSFRRIAANGFTGDIFIALLIGTLITLLLLAAWLAEGAPDWLKAVGRGIARVIGSIVRVLGALAPSGAGVYRAAAALGIAALAVGAGWLVWRGASAVPLPSLASLTGSSTIEGRATAVAGDRLRIDGRIVQLSGIEAPERDQTCVTDRSRRWRCGASATASLAALVRRRQVTCALSGSADGGAARGRCHAGDTDIAAELVRNGHVFATGGLFAPYASLENEARAARIGLWDGEADRPSDYRAQRWEEAKRDAPDGCPIKGNVRDGRRVYVLPWSSEYERIRVSSRRGDRWFCSEAEAVTAGWRPLEQS
jgi:endonuclease YncB( thermonuclease family)